jgi:hypothetical protein
MSAVVSPRSDFDAVLLRKLARDLMINMTFGGSQSDATWSGGVTLQIVRDGVLRLLREARRRADLPALLWRLSLREF